MSKKKAEQQTNIDLTDVQKRMDQYVKACEKEKKGKTLLKKNFLKLLAILEKLRKIQIKK